MTTIKDVARNAICASWGITEDMFDGIWDALETRQREHRQQPITSPTYQEYSALASIGPDTAPVVIAVHIVFSAADTMQERLVRLENLSNQILNAGKQAGFEGITIRITMEIQKHYSPDTMMSNTRAGIQEAPIVATAHRHDHEVPQELTETTAKDLVSQRKMFRIFIAHRRERRDFIGEVYFDGAPMHEPTPPDAHGRRTHLDFTEYRILRHVLVKHRSAETYLVDLLDNCIDPDQRPQDDLRALQRKDPDKYDRVTKKHRARISDLSKIIEGRLGSRLISDRKELYHLDPWRSYCVIEWH